jgi:hypothetical protein
MQLLSGSASVSLAIFGLWPKTFDVYFFCYPALRKGSFWFAIILA